jgi:hypothetical protein
VKLTPGAHDFHLISKLSTSARFGNSRSRAALSSGDAFSENERIVIQDHQINVVRVNDRQYPLGSVGAIILEIKESPGRIAKAIEEINLGAIRCRVDIFTPGMFFDHGIKLFSHTGFGRGDSETASARKVELGRILIWRVRGTHLGYETWSKN